MKSCIFFREFGWSLTITQFTISYCNMPSKFTTFQKLHTH